MGPEFQVLDDWPGPSLAWGKASPTADKGGGQVGDAVGVRKA